jgi:hypothetical protein
MTKKSVILFTIEDAGLRFRKRIVAGKIVYSYN